MAPTSPAEPVAYTWPLSVLPGEPVALFAAGPPVCARVVVTRIGAHRDIVWTGSVEIEPHRGARSVPTTPPPPLRSRAAMP